MEELKKLKRIIERNQNFILIFSSERQNDSVPAATAFFYALKQMGKNVSIISPIPDDFNFLLPQEKNNRPADFLISIKEQNVKIIDVFYEKHASGVNLFLKTSEGAISPEDISLKNLTQAEPPVYLALGFSHFSQLSSYFKALPDTLININTPGANENYGHLNLTTEEASTISELILNIISFFDENLFSKEVSTALLSGLMQAASHPPTEPLTTQTPLEATPLTGQTLQKVSFLIEQGADIKEISERLCKSEQVDEKSLLIFEKILGRLNFSERRNIGWALLEGQIFQESNASIKNIAFSLKKLASGMFPFESFFLLWERYNSSATVQGIFYSPELRKIEIISRDFKGTQKGNGILFQSQESNMQFVKNKILEIMELG